MPKRCSDTHFYVSGHKTRSGQAVYTTPDGSELAVVCGRNRPGPGQIHLRDVPDGVTLTVTGHGGELELELDQAKTRGRTGRVRLDALDLDVRAHIVWNNVAELPAHHGDYRWASEQVGFWVDHATARHPDGIVPSGCTSVLGLVRSSNAHRYADGEAWRSLAWSGESGDQNGYGPTLAYATRLCGQVCGMDPARDRRAFDAALRELMGLARVFETEIPPQYHDRLVALIAAEAPRLGRKTLEQLAQSLAPAVSFDLVSRMVATHGVPNATVTRSLGQHVMGTLLREKSMLPADRAWVTLGILANERLAAFHEHAASATVTIPDELVPAAHKLACPAAAKLLAALRPDAMTPPPHAARRRAEGLARCRERASTPLVIDCPAHALPLLANVHLRTTPLPSQDRIERAAGIPRLVKIGLRDWDERLRPKSPAAAVSLGAEWVSEYVDCGVASFTAISRLSRNGIAPWELELLDDAGVRTTSQQMACRQQNVTAADLVTLRSLDITDVSDALHLARHHVTAEWALGYDALGIRDQSLMVRLGDRDVSPAGLAGFLAAGRSLDEALTQAAQGVPGQICLALTGAGVDDPVVQARLCRIARTYTGTEFDQAEEYLDFMSMCGLVGDDLVTAIERKLAWEPVRNAAAAQLPFAEFLQGVDAGIPEFDIDAYCDVGIRSSREWALLAAAKIPASKVAFLHYAGVDAVEEMLPYANAPIESEQDAVNCVAIRSRSRTSATGTAEALL